MTIPNALASLFVGIDEDTSAYFWTDANKNALACFSTDINNNASSLVLDWIQQKTLT